MRSLLLLLIIGLVLPSFGHMRFRCPIPRSEETGIKGPYPCGSQNDDWSGPVTTISPGPFTIYYEESISHRGAPFRVALSINDDTNYDLHVLVDHIPHNDAPPNPIFNDPSTYKQYRLTINIPNIDCPRCTLSLINPMTDKIPIGSNCTYPKGTNNICASVYHSCANVVIKGSIPPPQWQYEYNPPPHWTYPPPFSPYTQEVGTWNNGWLAGQNNVPVGECSTEMNIQNENPTDDNNGTSGATTFAIVVAAVACVALVALLIASLTNKSQVTKI